MTRTIVGLTIISSLLLGTGYPCQMLTASASAQEDWKAEFDDVCGWTTDSMSLSRDEIKALIDRCDKLKPRLEKLEGSTAKVYLKRLKMCRDLFVYVLESKTEK